MKRLLASLSLTICFCTVAFAQDKKLQEAAKNGAPVLTQITVRNNVSAQAVLIPHGDARRIFGKEIAERYAVIQVTVGNKSPDAALIIQGIFIDYSRWALSGTTNGDPATTIESFLRNRFEPFQSSTNPNQVGSVESRVVRGQLLDAQMFSKRNITMRLLTFAGSLTGAYQFSIGEEGIIRGLNAFSGVFVPGMREVWPDRTVEQINRVSDFGYQTNKVIPRQGAEIIVCFFPIDRFLTRGLKKIFLRSPALFFAPLQMLVDKKIQRDVTGALGNDLGIDSSSIGATDGDVLGELHKHLPCYLRIVRDINRGPAPRHNTTFLGQMNQQADRTCLGLFGLTNDAQGKIDLIKDTSKTTIDTQTAVSRTKFASFLALDYLSQISLNNVSITIDGVMTVDTTGVVGKIETLTFDKLDSGSDDKTASFWDPGTESGERSGTISGSYLTGGTVTIADAVNLGIKEINTVHEGLSDQTVRFSFKLIKPIAPKTKLQFIVTKAVPGPSLSGPKTVESAPKEYEVNYSISDPTITEVKAKDADVTVTGTGFYDLPPEKSLKVTLHPPGGDDLPSPPKSVKIGELVLDRPPATQPSGCWTVTVKVGTKEVTQKFAVEPTITSAVMDGTGESKKLRISGSFLDSKDCQTPAKGLEIQLQNGLLLIPLSPTGDQVTSQKISIPLTTGDAANAGPGWKVRIRFNGTLIKEFDLN